jgi:membrane-associated protein
MDPLGLLKLVPDLLAKLVASGQPWIGQYGYLAIAAGMCAETLLFAGYAVPGFGILVAAGYFSAAGLLNPGLALPLAAAGTIAGDQASYGAGRVLGHWPLRRSRGAGKVRRALLAEGPLLLVWYHFAPYLRALLPVTAGTARYTWPRFAVFDSLGAALWNAAVFWIGYSAYGSLHSASNFALLCLSAVAFLFALIVCYRVFRRAAAKAPVQPVPANAARPSSADLQERAEPSQQRDG